MVGVDGTGLQGRIVVLPDKELVVGNIQLLADLLGAVLGDPTAILQLREAPDRHAGLPGQLCLAGLALLHPGGEVHLRHRLTAVPHAFLLQVGVEGGDVSGLQILQLDMAEGLVDDLHRLLVAEGSLFLQVRPGVLLQEDLREVHQPDVAVLGQLVSHPLFKECGLSVQGLLDLPLRHPRLRRPCHLLADLLAVDVVPIGHDDPVALASLFNCGH